MSSDLFSDQADVLAAVRSLEAEIRLLRAEVAELRDAGQSALHSARAWSMKAAAAELGVSRSDTLMPAIERGTIKAFRRGKRRFISAIEMDRLRREWLPSVKGKKRTTPDRSARAYPDACAI